MTSSPLTTTGSQNMQPKATYIEKIGNPWSITLVYRRYVSPGCHLVGKEK